MEYAALLVFACALWGAYGFPYHIYGSNRDTLPYDSSGSSRSGIGLSRYYNPHYNTRTSTGGIKGALLYRPEEQYQPQASQYYRSDRRRQANPEAYVPFQQNEAYYPQAPEKPLAFEPTELVDPLPTEKVEIPTTIRAIAVPELTETEIQEIEEPIESRDIVPAPKKRVTKKKQFKRPVDDEEEDDGYSPKLPSAAYFPMFFGWGGGRSSGGAPNGATAISNAFSTGRGGVANSHATSYGPERPESN